MKKTIIGFALSAALMLGASTSFAQGIKMPAPSPSQKVEQAVGLSTVSVDYSRPSMKGREIFGDLVPYGRLWRTGANASTKIKFSEDVTIEGNKVPAGEYALYTIPGKDEWTVIIHKNTKHWGDGGQDYKPEEDLVRFKVKPQQNPREVESFTINFTNLTADATDVELLWDNTIVPFTVKTDVDSKVMSQIQEQVLNNANANPGLYAAAANYYFQTNRDLKQALEWMKKANQTDPKFWNLHTQAKIEAKMKDYKQAIKTAEKSKEVAQKEGNQDYVALNEKAIAEWKKAK
ncbi:Protein of unknown function (DUF2911) [Pontibacter ummariensis]|uniref:DUF2911 domain-containing protein n=1 Tax=Pontibacter ummariensis TaxID=1610492 RepID=A0A239BH41_9BACT|nr:DUF2911 domain-containing protein [Pontibacter ummariensis]PRY16525.1 Protein of unknown function (DUF2911) [Pontibacter ummariensis]SNS06731.1 Protein of unknown function [Pontibacter ummariensis]